MGNNSNQKKSLTNIIEQTGKKNGELKIQI